MGERVDLYGSYGDFAGVVLAAVRRETFGEDIGQNSWTSAEEYARFAGWLGLRGGEHVLEVACGAGGPALHMARTVGCRVTGVDSDAGGIAEATRRAGAGATFLVADANAALPFADGSFDGVVCVDAVNHLRDRAAVLREWRRVLRPGGRAVFTDPVVVTGAVTAEELAVRASIGFFLFVPRGENERLIEEAGLRLVGTEDVTENAAVIAGRWRAAREAHREGLVKSEGAERFEGLHRFFGMVHRLAAEKRLSRVAFVVEG